MGYICLFAKRSWEDYSSCVTVPLISRADMAGSKVARQWQAVAGSGRQWQAAACQPVPSVLQSYSVIVPA